MRWRPRQKRIALEVVQTSAMDCGPAALKCLLEGFGVPVSYGRLREACQTSVDGTSIDVIEEVARELGLLAEQVVLPADHLFLSCAQNLPALMITLLPSGATHFVVAWSAHGPLIQLMDPAQGRRLITQQALLDQLYMHEMHVLASDWEEWARSPEFTDALKERLARNLSSTRLATKLLDEALAAPAHYALARLDAATRFVATLPREELDASARGALLTSLLNLSLDEARAMIPASCWSALPLCEEAQQQDGAQAPMIRLRGAVCVLVKGLSSLAAAQAQAGDEGRRASLSRSLQGREPSTLRWMLSLCWAHARRNLFMLALCGAILSLGGLLEALLMQELFVAGRELTTHMTRLGAATLFLLMALILWGAQLSHHLLARQTGRHLEQRLRIMLHERLPWLKPQYFSSRLHSDMIERAHALSATRQIAHFIAGVWQALLIMVSAALGLWWLARDLGGVILGCLVALTLLPLVVQPFLRERELRARVHAAARGQVVLDALLGSVPARAHGAQEDLRVAHEGRLVSWVRAQRAQVSAHALVRALQAGLIATSSAALVWSWWRAHGELTGALLLVYWAQRMGDGAYHLAMRLFDYPTLSNVMARQHELIHGEEEEEALRSEGEVAAQAAEKRDGMSLRMRDCGARQAGHEVLRGINAEVKPGQHIAIVGASGAGKSTLLKLIMGLVEDVQGTIELDGRPPSLWMASEEIAWIDAANHLWNESILENVCYGLGGASPEPGSTSPGEAMEQAELLEVLARTTSGMRSSVGEQGGLLSGGEGQRVRIARALMTWDRARLIILDEALRGLERARRERLLDHLMRRASQKTMLVVTHDLSMTRRFDEVWVLSQGELVERGSPAQLIAQETSRYRRMLDAEARLHQRTWGAATWRIATLEDGKLHTQQHAEREHPLHEERSSAGAPQPSPPEAARREERPHDMFAPDDLERLLEQLISRCSTPTTRQAPRLAHRLTPARRSSEEVTRWLGDQGAMFGLEIRALHERCDRVDAMLRGGLPLILGCRDERGALLGFRVAVRRRGDLVELLLPDGGSTWARASSLRESLTGRVTQHEQRMQQLLEELGTSPTLAAKLSRTFVRLRKNPQHSPTHWHVQRAREEQNHATMWSSIAREARAGRWFMAMLSVGLLGYAMMSLGWWLLGRGSLMGEGSAELLVAWSGALAMGALCVGMEVWIGGEMALRIWRAVLMRVMDGALAMPELKRRGVGELMGQLYEAEGAVEALLDGGVMALMGALALLCASWVMWQGEGGERLIVAMLLFGACVLVASTRWMRMVRQWTLARIGLTGVLVDRMLGHTTRQLQRPRTRWYEGEEERLGIYLERSKQLDERSAWLHGWMSRGWYTLAWVVLAPVWIKGGGVSLAVSWGGVLLAAQGFVRLSGSMEALGRGWVAHGELGRFLSAAQGGASPRGEALVGGGAQEEVRRGEVVLRGHGMVARVGERISPILSECEVVIRQGEQWLIKGGSGAGKSTLASVLGGERALDAGVVVSRSGDMKALGERLWRREVMVVPQFHENHIFRGTLAMNMLLGQGWPAEPEALGRCEEVLLALGMGEVLARMPGGLNQMVGESGWSLSHGEKNRIYIARALLGSARVVIFDESFSALDPETAERVIALVKERLPTIIVIAHP